MKPQPLSQEEFDHIYSRIPKLAVDVIVKTPEGIILTKRNIKPWKGLWHIPGGTVYFGEHLEEAVKRVAKDELGIEVEIIKIIGAIEYFDDKEGYKHCATIVFLTEIKSGNLQTNFQATEVKTFNSIPENIIQAQKYFLEENKEILELH